MNIILKERSEESLEEINSFYKLAGYSGQAREVDRIFLVKVEQEIIGSVRISNENGIPVLRGMFMHPEYRGTGIGKKLLKLLPPYLDSLSSGCYALPYDHLLGFYETIGFRETTGDEAPDFLKERFEEYRKSGLKVALIKRVPQQKQGVYLTVLPDTLSVCRLSSDANLPSWALSSSFHSIIRTPDELSIVCAESGVPMNVKAEHGWRCLKVKGPLDFGIIGLLASLSTTLANAGISIFALSTFDTDYILLKEDKLSRAITELENAGHVFLHPEKS